MPEPEAASASVSPSNSLRRQSRRKTSSQQPEGVFYPSKRLSGRARDCGNFSRTAAKVTLSHNAFRELIALKHNIFGAPWQRSTAHGGATSRAATALGVPTRTPFTRQNYRQRRNDTEPATPSVTVSVSPATPGPVEVGVEEEIRTIAQAHPGMAQTALALARIQYIRRGCQRHRPTTLPRRTAQGRQQTLTFINVTRKKVRACHKVVAQSIPNRLT
ncbi:hypothetical protein MYSE111917_03140 [Mycobacterium senriense]